jgi:tartrate dehydrogenase/decarboxylase / D-malate dehydrogenase
MKSFRIALYPGDGIGPEVIDQAVRVLDRVQGLDGSFTLEFTRLPWGCDHHFQHGAMVAKDYLDTLAKFDAILLGAIGDPRRIADSESLRPLIEMRQRFDQYACVRPARLVGGVRSLLAQPREIDLVVVRENSEGEYLPGGGRVKPGEPEEVAIQTAIHTRRGIARILQFGFKLAQSRRRRLTMITKSNALPYGFTLWEDVLEKVRTEFSDVEADRQHVDAAAMNFVRRPESFDVVVSSNLFGDILSDLAGAIVGGLGLLPSANLNPERRFPSMFEPVHGSAPDIVGKGIANPIAAILSAAMMLDWLEQSTAAARIRSAVEQALAAGARTPDLGGELTTAQVTDRLLELLG